MVFVMDVEVALLKEEMIMLMHSKLDINLL